MLFKPLLSNISPLMQKVQNYSRLLSLSRYTIFTLESSEKNVGYFTFRYYAFPVREITASQN